MPALIVNETKIASENAFNGSYLGLKVTNDWMNKVKAK